MKLHKKSSNDLRFPVIEDLPELAGKTVLVRMDLNVPMRAGKVEDATRIVRLLPTLKELLKQKAKVVILSHFDRPGGKFVPSMSLAPLVDPLAELLDKKVPVKFGVDCVGTAAREAVDHLKAGEVLLLENLRFHPEEEKGDAAFARELASLGDVYINDAFSCSHRKHASVMGINTHLPYAAGRLMQAELEMLERLFSGAGRPLAAIVGGAKVSTKLELLENLMRKVDLLVIGGAMANTFLAAQGHEVGESLMEEKLVPMAKKIIHAAEKTACKVLLPVDVVVADEFRPQSANRVVPVKSIPKKGMVLDLGPETLLTITEELKKCKTVVWNGPLGAFETSPYDVSTLSVARVVASLTRQKKLQSIGGGGDTLAALSHAGLSEEFSYLSTAGGAFLEWMEGKSLPGVEALYKKAA